MKLLRHLANLGYGSRREVRRMIETGCVTDAQGSPLGLADDVPHANVRVDGQPLDPPQGMVLMLHKPLGVTCSHVDRGRSVYALLPTRYLRRKPVLSSVGRLDRDTSGLLLLTDDGDWLHRVIAPHTHVAKIYEATLAQDLHGDEAALFAAGTLVLRSESHALAPARLDVLERRRVRVTLTEGRYHQVRRMFAATGNRVVTLQRLAVGDLTLGGLEPGAWRQLDDDDMARVFVDPPFGCTPDRLA